MPSPWRGEGDEGIDISLPIFEHVLLNETAGHEAAHAMSHDVEAPELIALMQQFDSLIQEFRRVVQASAGRIEGEPRLIALAIKPLHGEAPILRRSGGSVDEKDRGSTGIVGFQKVDAEATGDRHGGWGPETILPTGGGEAGLVELGDFADAQPDAVVGHHFIDAAACQESRHGVVEIPRDGSGGELPIDLCGAVFAIELHRARLSIGARVDPHGFAGIIGAAAIAIGESDHMLVKRALYRECEGATGWKFDAITGVDTSVASMPLHHAGIDRHFLGVGIPDDSVDSIFFINDLQVSRQPSEVSATGEEWEQGEAEK